MFFTAARENNEIIDEFRTYEKAKKAISKYLIEDRKLSKDGITKYDPNFYCILDGNKNIIEQYTAASMLGRVGGSSCSKAKQKSSRENGKLGGRPKIKKSAISDR